MNTIPINLEHILDRLVRFLDRKQIPRHLDGKERAQEDELRALALVIDRYAPRSAAGLELWWPRLETQIGLSNKGFWPTEKDFADAARAVAQEDASLLPTLAPKTLASEASIEHAAKLMCEGRAVTEAAFYGLIAAGIEARGLVPEDVMEGYRKGAYEQRQKQYGGEVARAWLDEAKRRHELAKDAYASRNPSTEGAAQ